MPRLLRALVFVLTSALCIGCDRVTKVAAVDALKGSEPLQYAGGIVRLEYAENTGAFLGLGNHLGPQMRFWVLGIGTAAILVAIAAALLMSRTKSWWSLVALTLVLAGGAGNLWDRLSAGYVVDFMNVGVGGLRTGIFNVADMAITFGVLVLLLPALFRRREKSLSPPSAGSAA